MVSLCQDILALSQELKLPVPCSPQELNSPWREHLKTVRFPKEVMPLLRIVFL